MGKNISHFALPPQMPEWQSDTHAPVILSKRPWLLLDSRVVDVPMASNSTFVMLSSLKPLLFKSLKRLV